MKKAVGVIIYIFLGIISLPLIILLIPAYLAIKLGDWAFSDREDIVRVTVTIFFGIIVTILWLAGLLFLMGKVPPFC